jgi:hypothetical protein
MEDQIMSKYSPLGDFLRMQKTTLVPMTFAEIERIVGSKLPKSQRYPAWWSNNPWNNVMTQVWRDAGFETEQVDVERGRLVFRRVREEAPAGDGGASSPPDRGAEQHPLFGCLKGTVQVGAGVDLTDPADPEWGVHVYEDQPHRDRR